jgi:hypothetical protein
MSECQLCDTELTPAKFVGMGKLNGRNILDTIRAAGGRPGIRVRAELFDLRRLG